VRYLKIIFVSTLLLISCGNKSDESADTKSATVDRNTNLLLVTASSHLINEFGKELKTELMSALNEGGPAQAISVCEVRAPEIAAANSGEFWTIRRVTDRNRNPNNLASDIEMDMLARFADTAGVAPEYLMAWNVTDSGKIYHYYRPITVAPLCVKCHGTATDIDDAVAAVLAEKYPADRAIGYTAGDLRGMFVVEIRWPEGKPIADSLAAAAGRETK
jgi:hypothetical protein